MNRKDRRSIVAIILSVAMLFAYLVPVTAEDLLSEDVSEATESSADESGDESEGDEAEESETEGEEEEANDSSSEESSEPDDESSSEEGSEPDDGSSSEESSEPDDGSSSEESSEPDDGSSSEESSEPDDGSSSEESSEPDDGSSSEESSEPDDSSSSEEGSEPDDSSSSEEGSEPDDGSSSGESSEPDDGSSSEESSEPGEIPDPLEPDPDLPVPGGDEPGEQEPENPVYEDGTILIYHYDQLTLIGSGLPVRSMDSDASSDEEGEAVYDGDREVTYDGGARYSIMEDIVLDGAWSLPDEFSGSIEPLNGGSGGDLYDAGSGSIYIYNPYQLDARYSDEPVRSDDATASRFGIGEPVQTDGEGLTYSADYQYVLSARFDSDRPEIEKPEELLPPVEEEPEAPDEPAYEDGVILIYSFGQLELIGNGDLAVTNFDSDPSLIGEDGSEEYTDDDGDTVYYSLDGQYRIAEEIALPAGASWQLPEGFTGRIAPESAATPTDMPLYEETTPAFNTRVRTMRASFATDTDMPDYPNSDYILYLYHPKQLEVIGDDTNVLTGDISSATFSSGQPIQINGDAANLLTYDPGHQYVISELFDSELVVPFMAGEGPEEGRDFLGQVVKYIGGVPYILIGNEQQLRAIGTDIHVFTEMYDVPAIIGDPTKVYPGDADLAPGQALHGFLMHGKDDAPFLSSRQGVIQTEGADRGQISPTVKLEDHVGDAGVSYSADANYIIFRDIDLSEDDGLPPGEVENGIPYDGSAPWRPMTFNGVMKGMKADAAGALWPEGTLASNLDRAVISNINIAVSEIDVESHTGVGFFGTISGDPTYNTDLSITGAEVSGLELQFTGGVSNTETTPDIGSALQENIIANLTGDALNLLTGILNFKKSDPTTLATGAFAGRVIGAVKIENCVVSGVGSAAFSVQNSNAYTGGFVGYTSGITMYSGISTLLGGLVDTLNSVLNAITGLLVGDEEGSGGLLGGTLGLVDGLLGLLTGGVLDSLLGDLLGGVLGLLYLDIDMNLGLDDIVDVVLSGGGLVNLGALNPSGYISPTFTDCAVLNLSGSVGTAGVNYAGGFAGQIVGASLTGCTVASASAGYDVKAANYAGGFAGQVLYGEIEGTLTGGILSGVLGLNLGSIKSSLATCGITGSGFSVSGTSNIGGFTGALENSDISGSYISVSGAVNVTGPAAASNYIGGFAGIIRDKDVSEGVLGLLGIGGVDFNKAKSILTNCTLSAPSLTVSAVSSNYVGGFAGMIQNSNATGCIINVSGAMGVTGNTQYIGGFAGFVRDGDTKGPLAAIGINLIDYSESRSTLSGCQINGTTGLTVGGAAASNYIGGFVGALQNSSAENCTIGTVSPIGSLTVNGGGNYIGGFAGLARDGEVRGALSIVNITTGDTESLLLGCGINAASISAENTATGFGSYMGGFVGALANSYAVNCVVTTTGLMTIKGAGSNIGGFAGIAGLGWAISLGKGENSGLLSSVISLVGTLLGGEGGGAFGDASSLLSLVGIDPSAIMGCQITSGGLTVEAGGDYAGGIVGKGDGAFITVASQDYLDNLSYPITADAIPLGCGVTGLTSVKAKNLAGGIAGSLGTASTAGLVNQTLGLGSFLGFTVDGVTIEGTTGGYTVTATENYAAGGIAVATGGLIKAAGLSELASVTANNMAAGFAAVTGPGDLAGGGLTVGLPGLTLLNISNLLSVGQAVEVTIFDSTVTGIEAGYTVEATGDRGGTLANYIASGFVGESHSTEITDSHAIGLRTVTASDEAGGYAGGFLGISASGGLAELLGNDDEGKNILGTLVNIDGLLGAVPYLVPNYLNCTVSYVEDGDTGVSADIAGGFVADFQSGTFNVLRGTEDLDAGGTEEEYDASLNHIAVSNLDTVTGQSYAGGFGGRIIPGALAGAGSGISLLGGLTGINITGLLDVFEVYQPIINSAGVQSEGLTVSASRAAAGDSHSGSAGGFAGYVSGARISTSSVGNLMSTAVTPPDNLEGADGSAYFNGDNYSVTGGRYAGGYIGEADIGSAASAGGSLDLLGSIGINDIVGVLNAIGSTIEHSDVTGGDGGFSVLAQGGAGDPGIAGGFVGGLYGSHVQDSDANKFAFVISEAATGGYVGEMRPGDVASVMDDADILSTLVNIDNLLSALQVYIPSIRNSSTNGIPCGGVVRADDPDGIAGGYAGYNLGGQILGLNADKWLGEEAYAGDISVNKAERISSVYGGAYAGGFTGLMESADAASVGDISLLGGLVEATDLLGALSVMYPNQVNTAVYGPLANLSPEDWSSWVEHVGRYGGYGAELAQDADFGNLEDYIYGYNVGAGTDAGGYVGLMDSGAVTNGMAYDAKSVTATHSAGGFAGQMRAGSLADLGSVSALGVDLNLNNLLNIAAVLVPTISNSSVQGYRSGLTVTATGSTVEGGYAGGYVGVSYGGQIQTEDENQTIPDESGWAGTEQYPAPAYESNALKLRRIAGRNAAGGYVGLATAAGVAEADADVSDGFLQGVLDSVLDSSGQLISALQTTIPTIRSARVDGADPDWGFVVEGTDGYFPLYAGGFAGSLQAAVIGGDRIAPGSGEEESKPAISVTGVRRVDGQKYAGGFFGFADIGSVAEVGETSLISDLIGLGDIGVLDVFRTSVENAEVYGVEEGAIIQAYEKRTELEGAIDETRYTGAAGGFGGAMMNGSVLGGVVTNLSTVDAPNYAGGFIGHLGKSGVVDVDSLGVLGDFLGASVGALDLFGSEVNGSRAEGSSAGTVIRATGGVQPVAGGFAGYADLAKMDDNHVAALKKVASGQIAGGFVGRTDMNYLVTAELDSKLLDSVFSIVNDLLDMLYVGELQNLNVAGLNIPGVTTLEVLGSGNVASVNLLGLPISVTLVKEAEEEELQGIDSEDLVRIQIGGSMIRLACSQEEGVAAENIEINLIPANRTEVTNSSVTGIDIGYDVFGSGAGEAGDGSGSTGASGGFVGLNHEGLVQNNTMLLCDVVRGAAGYTGPFTGSYDITSASRGTLESGNTYSVYRVSDTELTLASTEEGDPIADKASSTVALDETTSRDYWRFDVAHMDVIKEFADLYNATMSDGAAEQPLGAYETGAKAVLMLDTFTSDNPGTIVPEPGEIIDPCYQGFVDLTIQKVWLDWGENGQSVYRPAAIEIAVYRKAFQITGEGEAAVRVNVEDPVANEGEYAWPTSVTMTAQDQEDPRAATWRKVIEKLPVSYVGSDGTITYFEYFFTERPVSGYVSVISNSDAVKLPLPEGLETDEEEGFYWVGAVEPKTYTLTITNTLTYRPALPSTGSGGDLIVVFAGVGTLVLGVSIHKRRLRGGKRRLRLSLGSKRY